MLHFRLRTIKLSALQLFPEAVLPPDKSELGLPSLDMGDMKQGAELLSKLAASPSAFATWLITALVGRFLEVLSW